MDPLTTPAAASASAAVESRGDGKQPPRKIRAACNRCHSQKLRCVRKQGEVSCERCLKLHTSCRFGPRAPRAFLGPRHPDAQDGWQEPPSVSVAIPMPNPYARPAMTQRSSSEWLFSPEINAVITEEQVPTIHPDLCYPMPGGLADMHDFWPDPFCEPGNANSLDQYGSLDVINQDPFRDTFPSPDSSDGHPRVDHDGHFVNSPASRVRNLANLNVALYDCAANLPSKPEAGVNPAGITPHGRRSRKKTLFALDELFRLTSEFIDVIQHLSREACDASTLSPITDSIPSSTSALSRVAHDQQQSHTGPGVTATGAGRPFSHVDEGTMLMIVSCHCRLTEIYLSIFHMMQACIEYSVAPPKETDWAIVLPRLQVGSLAAPPLRVDANTWRPSATPPMYMVMITMLSSQLCEKLAEIMRAGDEETSGAGGGIYSRGQGVGRVDQGPVSPSRYLLMTTVADGTDRLRCSIDATQHLLHRSSVVVE